MYMVFQVVLPFGLVGKVHTAQTNQRLGCSVSKFKWQQQACFRFQKARIRKQFKNQNNRTLIEFNDTHVQVSHPTDRTYFSENFGNRELRKILKSKSRRKLGLHNEELHNFYSLLGIITVVKRRRIRLAGYIEGIGEMTNAYRIPVGNREGDPSGDNIKTRLNEVRCENVD